VLQYILTLWVRSHWVSHHFEVPTLHQEFGSMEYKNFLHSYIKYIMFKCVSVEISLLCYQFVLYLWHNIYMTHIARVWPLAYGPSMPGFSCSRRTVQFKCSLRDSVFPVGQKGYTFNRTELSSLFINPLTPELNPSAQRCLTRFFYWGFCFLNRATNKCNNYSFRF
jgi:hypothetical protein